MPVNSAQDELYTVVENLTGGERVFGFLGARGMRLGAGEVVAIPGNLIATLGAKAHGGGRRRSFDAMERALKDDSLRINSTPAPVFWDPVDERPKSLAIKGGVLGTVDPTYPGPEESSSASFRSIGP